MCGGAIFNVLICLCVIAGRAGPDGGAPSQHVRAASREEVADLLQQEDGAQSFIQWLLFI